MALDMDDPHQWFTAGEVADLAKGRGIGEVPTTKSGMIKWIKRRIGESPGEWRDLSRKRPGREGGGGTEYHWRLFSGYRTRQLVKALEEEVSRRSPQPGQEPRGQVALAHLDWERPKQPGEVSFTSEDMAIMSDLLDTLGKIELLPSFRLGLVRKVRRSRVQVRWRYYFAHELVALEGKRVALACFGGDGHRVAFLWRYNEYTRELERHGRQGLICMIEPPPEPPPLDLGWKEWGKSR